MFAQFYGYSADATKIGGCISINPHKCYSTFTLASMDKGDSWHYRSAITWDAERMPADVEGPCEPTLITLPDVRTKLPLPSPHPHPLHPLHPDPHPRPHPVTHARCLHAGAEYLTLDLHTPGVLLPHCPCHNLIHTFTHTPQNTGQDVAFDLPAQLEPKPVAGNQLGPRSDLEPCEKNKRMGRLPSSKDAGFWRASLDFRSTWDRTLAC